MSNGTSTKSTPPVKRGRPKASDAPPAFDFASVEVEDSDVELAGKRQDPRENPFYAHVKDSWDSRERDDYGKTKVVKIPHEQAGRAMHLIRTAAEALELGASVRTRPLGDGTKRDEVVFCAKKRTLRPRKGEDPVSTPAGGESADAPA